MRDFFLKLFSEKNNEDTIKKKFAILAKNAGKDNEWAEEVFVKVMQLIEMG